MVFAMFASIFALVAFFQQVDAFTVPVKFNSFMTYIVAPKNAFIGNLYSEKQMKFTFAKFHN